MGPISLRPHFVPSQFLGAYSSRLTPSVPLVVPFPSGLRSSPLRSFLVFLMSFPLRPAYSRTFLVKRGKIFPSQFRTNMASVTCIGRFSSCFRSLSFLIIIQYMYPKRTSL